MERYLKLSMIPDPEAARRCVAADFIIRFTGGRRFTDPAECTAFNAKRYAW